MLWVVLWHGDVLWGCLRYSLVYQIHQAPLFRCLWCSLPWTLGPPKCSSIHVREKAPKVPSKMPGKNSARSLLTMKVNQTERGRDGGFLALLRTAVIKQKAAHQYPHSSSIT